NRDRHRELATSLQYGSPACLDRLPRAGPGSVRASPRRMAGCATPTRSAGHAPAGATADTKLTFQPDHPVGAGHTDLERLAHPIRERRLRLDLDTQRI